MSLVNFHKEERIALFIDGANLYGVSRALGFDIDYRKLLTWANSKGRMIRAYYYTALNEDAEFSPIRPLVDWLDYNGYMIVTKSAREFTDAQGRRKFKGSIDVELAVEALEMAPHLDHIILFTGDGDFVPLVEALQRKGLRVSVASTVASQPPMVSDELRRTADQFIELNDLAPQIRRAEQDHEVRSMLREQRAESYESRNQSAASTAAAVTPAVATADANER